MEFLLKKFNASSSASQFGYSKVQIGECCRGKIKTHMGFRWFYDYLGEKNRTTNRRI